MSRERLTSKDRKAEVLKAIDTLRQYVAGDAELESEAGAIETADDSAIGAPGGTDADAALAAQADAIAKEEKATVSQSATTGVELKDNGDQNAKANANWPLTDAEREKVASTLIKLADALLSE